MKFLSDILAKAGLVVDGVTQLNTVANATTDTDKFLVSDGGVVKYRTGAQLAADIGPGNLSVSTVKHLVKLGEAATKGQAVYVSSADGTNMIVSKASNASEATSSKTLGLLETGGILNDQVYVVTEGLLAGLDTSTAVAGDPVWLGTGGNVIFGLLNKPYAPAHLVFIGIVTRVQQNNGEIFVKVQNGFELKELHDVQITTAPADNTVLSYETSSSLYKMKSIPTLLGYTPASGTGVAGQVTYWTGTNSQAGSNNLFWDNANNRLTVGSAFAGTQQNFNVYSGALFQQAAGDDNKIYIGNNDSLSTSDGRLLITPFRIKLHANAGTLTINSDNLNIGAGVSLNARNTDSGSLSLLAGGTQTLKIFGLTRNVVIQNGGTFTDSGQRLQVTGDTLLKGSGNTSATTALIVQDSAGNSMFRVRNDSLIRIGNYNTLGVAIFPFTTNTSVPEINGSNLSIFTYETTGQTLEGVFHVGGNAFVGTSGTQYTFAIGKSFAPTSGTANFANLVVKSIINQTGGANGITRGLYINPTLTAAADWRSIEWSNNTGWGLYGAGTAANYLNGNLGIGATSVTNTNLRITKNITGLSVSFGVAHSGQVQSDVTTVASYFQSVASTQAATFSTEIKHYSAQQGTFGAGSTVSVQYGFEANSTLIGATNNYGFYGNIPSGTGRWNLYMNGTAANYLAGNLGIGITTPAGNLDVYNATSSSIYNRVGAAGANWVTTSTQSQIGTYTNHPLQIKTNDTSRIYITNGGNVLIGTTTDSGLYKLDVNGTMRVSGTSTFGGNLVIPMGSYDSPSLSFVNDSNTGLYSPLADNLELKTGTNTAVVLENQGVNLMQYSEEIGSFPTNFQNIACTIPGNVIAPDGKTNANLAVPDTSLNQHRLYRIYSTTFPFTMSVYAKAAGYNFISFGWSGGVAGETIIFDLVNGTISGTAGNHTALIENVGNGWFRCSLAYTITGAASSFSRWIIVRNANSTAAYSGDGTSGVYLWGWQMEENSAATSYIRTGATAVTRPQAVSVLGANLYGNLITGKVSAPSLNDLALTTDYIDRLTIKSTTGNIGIGTSTPGFKLDVVSSSGYNVIVGRGASGSYFETYTIAGTRHASFGSEANGDVYLGSRSNNPLIFVINNTTVGRIDTSGNLGLNVTPSAWGANFKAIQVNSSAIVNNGVGDTFIGANYYYDGANNRYINTDWAVAYGQQEGTHRWYIASSGTAGTTVSFTQAMTLDTSGRLGIGTTAPVRPLNIVSNSPQIRISDTLGPTTNFWEFYSTFNLTNQDLFIGNQTGNFFKLNNIGALRLYAYGTGARTGTVAYNLAVDADGNVIETAGGVVDGSGTANYIPRWQDANTLANSVLYQGTRALGVNTATPVDFGAGTYLLNIYDDGVSGIHLTNSTTGQTGVVGMRMQSVGNDLVFINNQATGVIRWLTNGAERMRLDASGNLGLGTTSPTFTVGGGLQIVNSTAAVLKVSTGTNIGFDFIQGTSENYIYGRDNFPIIFATNSTERMRITAGGNVGIGTSTPAYSLDVNGAIRIPNSNYIYINNAAGTAIQAIGMDSGNNLVINTATGGDLYLRSGGSTVFRAISNGDINIGGLSATASPLVKILNNGNVGIGTTTPSTKLHVSGGLQVGDSTVGQLSLRLTRTHATVLADAHYYVTAQNTPVQSWIEGGFMTGERAGTVTASNSGYPYYEEYAGQGSATAKTFGFINVNTGNFTGTNIIGALVLKRTGQLAFPLYTSTSSFTGTAVAGLAVDSSGNLITTATGGVSGTGTANYMTKWLDADTITNSIVFDNGTNVGVGTAAPSYKLHVTGIVNADDGFVNGQATFHKSVSLGNIGAGVTYTLGQLNFGSVYTHHFTVRVSSYAGTKVFTFVGYQSLMSKLVSGAPYQQSRFDALDVIIESVTNVGGEITGVKIGIKNGSAGEDYIYSATIECLSSFGGWAALASNTVLTPYNPGTLNYVVAQAGSVGVGTTSPTSKLNIVNSAATPGVKIEHSAAGHAALWATTNEYGLLLQGSSTSSSFYLASISSGAVSRFYVRADGNIGIGTDTPSAKLVVNGTTWINQTADYGGAASKVQISAGSISDNVVIRTNDLYLYNYGSSYGNLLRFGNGSETWNIGATSGATPDFRLYEANGTAVRLTIKAGGNVGISVASPVAYLDITGVADIADTASLHLRSGNSLGNFNSNQILFSYNNSAQYRHAIKTRHNSGATSGNAIDFYTWKYGTDTANTIGTQHVMSINGQNVGIGTTSPSAVLQIARDGGAATVRLLQLDNTNSTYSQNVYLDMNTSKDVLWGQGSAGGGTFWSAGTRGFGWSINTVRIVTFTQTGSVGINNSAPDASAILQADSTSKGFLAPRMTAAQRGAITSPAVGLVVYQTDGTEGLWLYTSANGWKALAIVT